MVLEQKKKKDSHQEWLLLIVITLWYDETGKESLLGIEFCELSHTIEDSPKAYILQTINVLSNNMNSKALFNYWYAFKSS